MNRDATKILKALSDNTRADIVKKLIDSNKEVACKDLSRKFTLSQPTLSYHFNKLMDANILKVRKNGANHYYSIDRNYLRKSGIIIERII